MDGIFEISVCIIVMSFELILMYITFRRFL